MKRESAKKFLARLEAEIRENSPIVKIGVAYTSISKNDLIRLIAMVRASSYAS